MHVLCMKTEPTELHPLTFTSVGVATANVLRFLRIEQQSSDQDQQNNSATHHRDENSERDLVQRLKKGTA